jgi:uncharacterized protein (DUF2062 family)
MNSLREHISKNLHDLVHIHDTPHSIAGGAGIGIFFGFAPLFPLKTVLAIAFAWIFRCSYVAAVIGVTLHDVVFFITPVILRIEYQIGYWLLSHPHTLPPRIHAGHLHIQQWMHWATLTDVAGPMLLGSLVIGLPVATAGFFVTLKVVQEIQTLRARHQHHTQGDAPASKSPGQS